jgi:hypothetical protein
VPLKKTQRSWDSIHLGTTRLTDEIDKIDMNRNYTPAEIQVEDMDIEAVWFVNVAPHVCASVPQPTQDEFQLPADRRQPYVQPLTRP